MQSVQALASSRLGVLSEGLTALPDHTAPPCSFLLGRAAFSAASSGSASVPYPGCDEVEDRAVYISLAICMRESTALKACGSTRETWYRGAASLQVDLLLLSGACNRFRPWPAHF